VFDGGGLFKDFMEELLRQGFSPQVGVVVCTLSAEYHCLPVPDTEG
jgi:hypothetical protein